MNSLTARWNTPLHISIQTTTALLTWRNMLHQLDMSISWFIRSFKKYTGSTPIQFITSLRMTNAQVLLETTSYSINEIAGIVGYNNPLYFSDCSINKRIVLLLNTEPEIHNKKNKSKEQMLLLYPDTYLFNE